MVEIGFQTSFCLSTILPFTHRDRRGRDRMVVRFTTICAYHTKVVSLNPIHGEVYSLQHYMIKFVSDLRQVGGFLWVLCFPSTIKLTATI